MTVARLVVLYVLALCAPVAVLAFVGAHDLSTWLETGFCPGGPMDRPAAPCSAAELAFLVFLGGWAAFVVVPLELLYAAACTAAFALALVWLRRREVAGG